MAIDEMIKQLDSLIDLVSKYMGRRSLTGSHNQAESGVIANRMEAAIERMTVSGSVYRDQLKRNRSSANYERMVAHLQVILGFRADLEAGWTETVVELVHSDTYSDYLEMADALLKKGYKDAAAVITGTSLEVHVRALCLKNGIATAIAGSPKKADTMNADLKKAGVYDGLRQKQITAWMDLRNKAAHGEYDSYDANEARRFIDGVRAFLMKYPA
ncbi:hypothetical protein ABT160_39270 [Streptomyces sp. NPDC001941]|uniref:hypothetical protein n=1 Tax=Streptomyces sp. NPDC001941 TaxID=3154659 RepID=UPI003317518E